MAPTHHHPNETTRRALTRADYLCLSLGPWELLPAPPPADVTEEWAALAEPVPWAATALWLPPAVVTRLWRASDLAPALLWPPRLNDLTVALSRPVEDALFSRNLAVRVELASMAFLP